MQCTESNAKEKHEQVKRVYVQQLSAFSNAADSLTFHLLYSHPNKWQTAFTQARLAYKRIEIFTDYYYPSTAKAVNGPPVKEVEADDPTKEVDPSGFQVMEESLFPEVDTTAKEELLVQSKILQSLSQRLRNGLESLDLSNTHVFDALRLQLLRLISLGLAGGDNGLAQNSIPEAAVSLQAFEDYVLYYAPDNAFRKTITSAKAFLQNNPSFITFDRARFLVDFARPLWNHLYVLQQERNIPFLKETGLINTASPELFDSAFFNLIGFSQQSNKRPTAQIIEIGRRLFSDKRLSGNSVRSCATCHQPQNAYADGLAKNLSVDGKETIFRNTPTILYASLQPIQFADGRLSFLEDQAKAVIENHSEMKGDLKVIVNKLANDDTYRSLARTAFKKPHLDAEGITSSLAAFIQSQAPFRSSFDRYIRGERDAMNASALQGFNLFMGKAKCGTCHFIPLFNGVVPPHFSRMESEVIGVPKKAVAPFFIDSDEGKYRYTKAGTHRFAFKTPTLRNVALTSPYMHNGIYQTLEEVIEFYDKGGGAGFGISLENQTLPAEPLNLTADEKKALVHFLQSLTDR